MIKIKCFTFTILLFSFNFVMAQGHGGGRQGSGEPMKPGVVGKIMDATSNATVPYASVAVYKSSDSSLVTGTISSEEGRFFIPVDVGDYYVVINFMGYEKYFSKGVKVTKENPMGKVGLIKLQRSASELEGVNIVGAQTYVEYKIDRKIVNVGKDIGATGGSAVEALENVPSVSVDIDGNVSLRGSENFTVLINGKPSPLSGSDALQQIPTNVIKNIEIITNPSAKYDPDGTSGIINVVLKDHVSQGLNGMIEATAGSFDSYGLNTIFNYRKDKMNYFVGLDMRQKGRPGGGTTQVVNYMNDTNLLRDTELDRLRSRDNYTFKGGLDYYLDEKNTIGFSGAGGLNESTRDYTSSVYERNDPQTYQLYTISENQGDSKSTFFSGSLNWQHLFKREGEKIETYIYLNKDDHTTDAKQLESLSDEYWSQGGEVRDWFSTVENNQNTEVASKIDYTLKLKGDRKFEAGLQSKNYRENSKYVYDYYDTINNIWVNRPDYENLTIFSRDIISAYTTYGGTYKQFGYQLGLRGEYTNRKIEESAQEYIFEINRFDIFPTVHLSQKINETNSVMASYSRRIDRPDGHDLNPNPTYISSTFIRLGNPELEPEYSDNFELSYQKTIDKSFVSLEGFYRTTKNKISRLQEMDSNFVTYMTHDNLDRDHSLGFEMMANMQFYKWFRVNLSGSYYYYKIEGNISSGTVDQQSNNYNMRADVNFMITPLLRFQINGMYRGPSVTAQGKMGEFFMVNSALRYDFFKRKVTATFNVKDIFNTMKHEFETNTSTFYSYNTFNRKGPTFQLTVSYKMNNYKQERRPNMEGGGDGGDDI